MKGLLYKLLCALVVSLLPLSAFTSCKDDVDDGDTGEFTTNWAARNAAAFDDTLSLAKREVAAAQAQYGDDWESHCDWRIFRSYAKGEAGNSHDSICARVINRGTGAGYPLYTDSVKVNYIGRLIPTESYPLGRVFDHSGIYERADYVFSPHASTPTRLLVSNTVEGYTTAIMRMRIGDRWMVFIPQELGYTSVSSGVLPAYSTLRFDMELKGFYRRGTVVK